jgi:UDP-N-acetyl-D-mannosaminuronic acid dehydrogenase
MLVEPNVDTLPQALSAYPLVQAEQALADADVIAVLVNHKEFVALKNALRRHPQLIDAAGICAA